MAARQDQGLQIALIILIFLFILTGVAAYMGWKSYSDTAQRLGELNTQKQQVDEQVRKFQGENEQLRTWMGFGANDAFDSVEKTYKDDMNRFGAAIADETRRFYRTVLEAVHQEAADTAGREADAKQQNKDLTARFEALEAETSKQIAKYKEENKKLDEDNANERRKFNEHIAQMDNTKKELMANLDKQRTELEGQIAERDAKVKAFDSQVTELKRRVDYWHEQVPKDEESFEVPDGRVARVNQNGTVWINVGEADAIRRQVTFNVYNSSEHDADRATKKASIEVTQVLGDHLAEARVTQDDPKNPILTGDNIYSPVWHRGKKLRFALTGLIDFDNDGVSDMQLARDLITLNGGTVDAYLADDGKVEGEITPHTRYLVLGEFPESASRANLQKGWDEMNKKASDIGVETITLDQFLSRMGYTPQDRTVRLDSNASAQQFPARAPNSRELPSTAPETNDAQKFRARTPYRTPSKTPY